MLSDFGNLTGKLQISHNYFRKAKGTFSMVSDYKGKTFFFSSAIFRTKFT